MEIVSQYCPKVSVIVPVYNVESYLDRCVKSILNQTLKDIEIILVDDGSSDNCPAICDKYASKDHRVKVVHKKNAGLGMACNSGIEVALGEYIAFCDSDDWVDAEMYQIMYETAKTHDADAVYSGLKRVNGEGRILSYMPHPRHTQIIRDKEIGKLMCDLICANPSSRFDHEIQVSAKVVLYKKKFLDEYDLKFVSEREFPSEDMIFNVSVLSVASVVVVIDKYYYNYYVNESSISTTLKKDQFDKIVKSANLIDSIISKGRNIEYASMGSIRLARFIIGEARTYARQVIRSSCSKIEKKNLLKSLSSNIALKKAYNNYPLQQMPIRHRIAIELILSGNYYLIKYLF